MYKGRSILSLALCMITTHRHKTTWVYVKDGYRDRDVNKEGEAPRVSQTFIIKTIHKELLRKSGSLSILRILFTCIRNLSGECSRIINLTKTKEMYRDFLIVSCDKFYVMWKLATCQRRTTIDSFNDNLLKSLDGEFWYFVFFGLKS